MDAKQAARALGRRGGLKGGPARAAKLSSARRSAIARKGARAYARKVGPERRSAIAKKGARAVDRDESGKFRTRRARGAPKDRG